MPASTFKLKLTSRRRVIDQLRKVYPGLWRYLPKEQVWRSPLGDVRAYANVVGPASDDYGLPTFRWVASGELIPECLAYRRSTK